MTHVVERRRTPRVEPLVAENCTLEVRLRVQVLDISQSGALLGCETALPAGARGRLGADLAALPFSVELAVRRHQSQAPGTNQMDLGVQFTAIDERSRGNIHQFLSRGKDQTTAPLDHPTGNGLKNRGSTNEEQWKR